MQEYQIRSADLTGIFISFPSWQEREARECYRKTFQSLGENDTRHGAVLGFSTWESRQEADIERMDWLERYGEPPGFFYDARLQEWRDDKGDCKVTIRGAIDHARKAPEPKFDVIERPNVPDQGRRASSPASGLLDCPTCGTQPETRGWQTYCPTCMREATPGEVPDECEANWNKMITGQSNEQDAMAGLSASGSSARFLVQRPEYPDWWAGWNEYNLPSWTSHPGHAHLVRYDELVDTLTRLKKHKPIAALYSL